MKYPKMPEGRREFYYTTAGIGGLLATALLTGSILLGSLGDDDTSNAEQAPVTSTTEVVPSVPTKQLIVTPRFTENGVIGFIGTEDAPQTAREFPVALPGLALEGSCRGYEVEVSGDALDGDLDPGKVLLQFADASLPVDRTDSTSFPVMIQTDETGTNVVDRTLPLAAWSSIAEQLEAQSPQFGWMEGYASPDAALPSCLIAGAS